MYNGERIRALYQNRWSLRSHLLIMKVKTRSAHAFHFKTVKSIETMMMYRSRRSFNRLIEFRIDVLGVVYTSETDMMKFKTQSINNWWRLLFALQHFWYKDKVWINIQCRPRRSFIVFMLLDLLECKANWL